MLELIKAKGVNKISIEDNGSIRNTYIKKLEFTEQSGVLIRDI